MEQFIHQNGYLTVFIGVALSGEFGLIAGAALARTGAVTLTGVVILGTAASFIANTVYYYIGKFVWDRWKFLHERFGEKVARTSPVVRRYGSPLMLVARFFYGVRDIVPIALGLYRVGAGIFMVYNIIGAFIWAFVFTMLGNALSKSFGSSFTSIPATLLWGLITAAAFAAAYVLIRKAVMKPRG